jgi:lipopolysaccharide/colanic/teichoic acid biosynthesis glycosyltransferase
MNAKCKRLLDLSLAIIGLVIAAPLMAVIAVLVWLDSPGPIFFAQERLGVRGKPFRLYKFRKFPPDWGDTGPGVTLANDARMTRVGAILERTKLDELPQLWNVLKGDMSFVGARPESTRFSHLFTDRYAAILDHIPGIFGPTQFTLPDESKLYPVEADPDDYYSRVLFPQKAETDLAYFESANCLTDILWIVRGIWVSLASAFDWRRFIATCGSILLVDLALIDLGWIFANLLRFSGLPPGKDYEAFVAGLWIIPLVLVGGLLLGGCYRHPLRFFSLTDAIRLVRVTSLSWVLGYLILMEYSTRNASLYLVPMSWLLLIPLLAAPRVWLRVHSERARAARQDTCRRVIIYGAGVGGTALATWIKNGVRDLKLVGFLDDDSILRGRLVLGFRVLGQESAIPTIKKVHHIDQIWVTFQPDPLKRGRLQALGEQHSIDLIFLSDFEPFGKYTATPASIVLLASRANAA